MATPGLMFVESRVRDPQKTSDELFNRYYNEEHLSAVLASTQIKLALRYKPVGPPARLSGAMSSYIALYPIDDIKKFSSPDSLEIPKLVENVKKSKILECDDASTLIHFELKLYTKVQTYETDAEYTSNDERGHILSFIQIEAPGDDEEFDHWFRTHGLDLSEMAAGFRRCTRYKGEDSERPRYLVIVEDDSDLYDSNSRIFREFYDKERRFPLQDPLIANMATEAAERFGAELDLLLAMYPDSLGFSPKARELKYSHRHDESSAKPPAVLLLRLPDTYPLSGFPEVISATGHYREDLRSATKAAFCSIGAPAGEEVLDALLLAFRDLVSSQESLHQNTALQEANRPKSSETNVLATRTVIIWLHHLLNTNKRKLALNPSMVGSDISGITKPRVSGRVDIFWRE
ncbi:hypothetical protein EKO27_g10210 [Xylaria grammica]|uniref:Uncharacterized protein n=1 Tax=Xylaria grammica TaxID=363999 RepID=A0A439CRX1_9PEZI|nr:hypothetical protein EKO27_g10210 [Xylaria grammica]